GNHAVFHISEPSTAMLLALATRAKSVHILPVSEENEWLASTVGSNGTGPHTDTSRIEQPLSLEELTRTNTQAPFPSLSSLSASETASVKLRRRYAKVLALSTAGVIGIVVTALAQSATLETVSRLRRLIRAAGKKSYLVAVGRINAPKLANFAEVEGWVVVGC